MDAISKKGERRMNKHDLIKKVRHILAEEDTKDFDRFIEELLKKAQAPTPTDTPANKNGGVR